MVPDGQGGSYFTNAVSTSTFGNALSNAVACPPGFQTNLLNYAYYQAATTASSAGQAGSVFADTTGGGINSTGFLNSAGVNLSAPATLAVQVAAANLENAGLNALSQQLGTEITNLSNIASNTFGLRGQTNFGGGSSGGSGNGTGVVVNVTVTNSMAASTNAYGQWSSNMFVMGTNGLMTNTYTGWIMQETQAAWGMGNILGGQLGGLTGSLSGALTLPTTAGSASLDVDVDIGNWVGGNDLGISVPAVTLPKIVLDPSDPTFAPLGLIKLGWSMMVYGLLFWRCLEGMRAGLYAVLGFPQGTTAGSSVFGNNVNGASALVAATVIVSVFFTFVASCIGGLGPVTSAFSSASSAFGSGASSAGTVYGYILLVVPVEAIVACAAMYLLFRLTVDGLVATSACVIRMTTGL